MKFLFDFFPIILFFAVFNSYEDQMEGAIAATKVMIAASGVQIGLFWLKHRRFENMHLVTLALVVVLGGATIYFRNADFIMWKPTAVNWLFAVVFLGSEFIGKKSLLKRMMDKNISLPEPVWTRLTYAWVIFFTLMGIVNLYVAFNFPLDAWVDFKTFGMLGLTFAFVILQAFYMARHIGEPRAEDSNNQPEE